MVLKKNKDLIKGGTDSSSDEDKGIPKIRSLKEIYGSDSDSSKEKPMEDCKKAATKFKLQDDAKKLKSLLSTSGSQLTMHRKQYPRSTGIRIDDKGLSSIENTNSRICRTRVREMLDSIDTEEEPTEAYNNKLADAAERYLSDSEDSDSIKQKANIDSLKNTEKEAAEVYEKYSYLITTAEGLSWLKNELFPSSHEDEESGKKRRQKEQPKLDKQNEIQQTESHQWSPSRSCRGGVFERLGILNTENEAPEGYDTAPEPEGYENATTEFILDPNNTAEDIADANGQPWFDNNPFSSTPPKPK